MPLPFRVDKIDDVPEAQQALYKELEAGGFQLDIDGAGDIEDVTGLKSGLEKERQRRRELQQKLKVIPEDFDPDEWKKLREAKAAADAAGADKKSEAEKLRSTLMAQFDKDLKTVKDENASLRSHLEDALIDGAAATALAEAGGSVKLLMPHIKARTRMVQEDGKYGVRVIDSDGEPEINGKGDYLTIAGLVAQMREQDDFGSAFKASNATGGGATGRGTGGAGKFSKPLAQMSETEKLDYYGSVDLETIAAQAAAGVKKAG